MINPVTEYKSEELWKVSSKLQSTTSNSLAVPSMLQIRRVTGQATTLEREILFRPIYRPIY